jgi:hypothetical protein
MLLTIITSGKNDNYSGNFLQRLEFSLCKLIDNIDRLGVGDDVEIIVTDWGSPVESKLSDACSIPKRDYLKFLYVPVETTQQYSPDSKFSITHALNSAARRMNGENILSIDSDTYISFNGFSRLYEMLKNNQDDYVYYWVSRYHIPYKVQSKMKNIQDMDLMLNDWIASGKPLVENFQKDGANGFYHDKVDLDNFLGGACALLLSRDLVFKTTFLWETLTKWGWLDIEIHRRLLYNNYAPKGDLEVKLDSEFYHIGHHEVGTGSSINGANPTNISPILNANGDNWGLANEDLKLY